MIHLLVICKDNCSCSPMAATYLQHRLDQLAAGKFQVDSAGLFTTRRASVSDGARAVLGELGLEPLRIGTQAVQLAHLKMADLVICMSESQQSYLEKKFPACLGKVRPVLSFSNSDREVFEPRQRDVNSHRHCLAMMKPALEALAERLA